MVTPDFTISQTSPADYRQYELNFEYLEIHLGRARLLELIRESVVQADASLLYQELDITDGMQLAELAQAWHARRARRNLLIVLGVVLLLGWGLVSLAPEVECICGRQGRKSDFQYGVCPNCGRQVYLPPSVGRRLLSALAPSCEVCGRRFPPWRVIDHLCRRCRGEGQESWAERHEADYD